MIAAGAVYLLPALQLAARCEGPLCGDKGVCRQAIWPGAADLSYPRAGVLSLLHAWCFQTSAHIWLSHG